MLRNVVAYEQLNKDRVPGSERPVFHLTPPIGWLNDPNGFSWYGGKYHLFYQYYPYDNCWGPTHWGHSVSTDLLTWERKPVALAPDKPYDRGGCFSGTALELADGRHMLMYTGYVPVEGDEYKRGLQSQCIAFGDGLEYEKYKGNPVITPEMLPEGKDPYEFRDPKIWQAKDGTFRAIIPNFNRSPAVADGPAVRSCLSPAEADGPAVRSGISPAEADGSAVRSGLSPAEADRKMRDEKVSGICAEETSEDRTPGSDPLIPASQFLSNVKGAQMLLFRSDDGLHWEFSKVLAENTEHIGWMWECPDFFRLDGRQLLTASAMDVEGLSEYPESKCCFYFVGDYDEDEDDFRIEEHHLLDHGPDFYAVQTVETPDGRRVAVGWLQDPDTAEHRGIDYPICGQMSTPRELTLKDGRLMQRPVRELEDLHGEGIEYKGVRLSEEETSLDGISGRVLDMKITVRPEHRSGGYEQFTVRFARGTEELFTEFSYRPEGSTAVIDRTNSGPGHTEKTMRQVKVRDRGGQIDIRIVLDTLSAEIFINDGEQVISLTYYTDINAEGITFSAPGGALMDIEMHPVSI